MWRILPLNRSNIRLDGCLKNGDFVSLLIHHSNSVLEKSFFWLINSPVTQPQDIAHHRHHGQGAGVIGPPVKPDLQKKYQHHLVYNIKAGGLENIFSDSGT